MGVNTEFAKLLATCKDLSGLFDQGLVYIGGIAVYLHSANQEATMHLAEATHDADFYISFADMADLREIEEVTPNRRLSKSQFIKNGFEFDIYTERVSSLRVPYDEVLASSVQYDDMRVACLEHLLVLKLEAFLDRQNSAKGGKDARDIMRIAALVGLSDGFDCGLVVPYLDESHFELFAKLRKSPEAIALASGNAVHAKNIRKNVDDMLAAIESFQQPGTAETSPVPK